MNIVEGYVVNPDNEWCNPFALGEPKYSTKVKVLTWMYFSEDPSKDFHFFSQVRQKQRERAESLVATNNKKKTS